MLRCITNTTRQLLCGLISFLFLFVFRAGCFRQVGESAASVHDSAVSLRGRGQSCIRRTALGVIQQHCAVPVRRCVRVCVLTSLHNLCYLCYLPVFGTGNVNVIYAIVRRKELFERIASLTLPGAIRVSTTHIYCLLQWTASFPLTCYVLLM
jgi:hypothetical protein